MYEIVNRDPEFRNSRILRVISGECIPAPSELSYLDALYCSLLLAGDYRWHFTPVFHAISRIAIGARRIEAKLKFNARVTTEEATFSSKKKSIRKLNYDHS